MTFAPGFRIGPYEITAKLGEGGMGEVWRAHDPRLKRDVAIKVLPAAFVEDEERLARFEREAQVLAQLHHPNIASIFGLEDGDGVRGLVLELVEGPTLAERLEAGALPLEEALEIARRIAEALEEAHEKGIVHRDLKPQNVKVGADGKVKVLDFGLAKAMDPTAAASGAGSASQLAASPTLTLGATVQGVILGTAAYMAPEQAKGLPIDKRADVWAFGVVLYEMLTGARLFAGDSVPDTLAGVLRAEIDLGELPAATPAAVRRLLRRCLERKPKDRQHDIADARIVLDELARGEHAETAAVAPPEAAARRRSPGLAILGVAAALGLGVVAGWLLAAGAEAPGDDLEVALAIPAGYTVALDNYPGITLSADGRRQIVTVVDEQGQPHLLFRDLVRAEARILPGTAGGYAPTLSPDGETVVFVLEGGVKRMSILGGPPIHLADSNAGFRGAAWGTDGDLYLAPDSIGPLMRLSANGGELEPVTQLDAGRRERTHRWPDVLPDASAVLFTCDTTDSTEFYDDARIEAVRLATGERKVILEGSSQARFLAPDHLLFARAGTIFAVRFDARELAVVGSPVPLVQGVSTDVSSGAVRFATAVSGAAVWVPGELGAQERRLEWIAADGAAEPLGLSDDRYSQIALSPDERRLAAVIDSGLNTMIWVYDLETRNRSRLTFTGAPTDIVWSPDGRHLVYASPTSTTGLDLYRKAADGSGDAELLHALAGDEYPGNFTPDGRTLLFESHLPGRAAGPDVLALDLAGGEVRPLLAEEHSEGFPALSPDGRWLAYATNEGGGASRIVVRRYPELSGQWQVSSGGGDEPRWSPDGTVLFYREAGVLYRVPVETGDGFVAGAPVAVVDAMVRGTIATTFAVTRDGRVLRARDTQGAQRPERVHYASNLAARARRSTAQKR